MPTFRVKVPCREAYAYYRVEAESEKDVEAKIKISYCPSFHPDFIHECTEAEDEDWENVDITIARGSNMRVAPHRKECCK